MGDADDVERQIQESKAWPWAERVSSKVWKIRSEAYVDIAKACSEASSPDAECLREFAPLFKKAVEDTNAPAQEKAVEALNSFLEKCGDWGGSHASEVCDSLVGKCLGGRPKTVKLAQSAILLFVELDAADAVSEALVKGYSHKLPKVVLPAVESTTACIRGFGTKVVQPKPIIQAMAPLYEHKDAKVRGAIKDLTKELSRWLGAAALKSLILDKMRESMKAEVEKMISDTPGAKAVPERRLRKHANMPLPNEPAPEAEAEEANKEEAIDVYDCAEAVDVLSRIGKMKIGEDEVAFWDALESKKWSERRDALCEAKKLAQAPKLKEGDYGDLARHVGQLLKDANVAVATEACQLSSALACGLRKDFQQYARSMVATIIERLKEKQSGLNRACKGALNDITDHCLGLSDIVDDIGTGCGHKVAKVRTDVLEFADSVIAKTPKGAVAKAVRDLMPFLVKAAGDNTADVRDAAFKAMASIARKVGMQSIEKYTDKLEPAKKDKLQRLVDSGAKKDSSRSEKKAPPAVPVKPKDENPAPKKVKAAAAAKSKRADIVEESTTASMTNEELEAAVGKLANADILTKLKSTMWKERLEGMTDLNQCIDGLGDSLDQHAEVLVRFLCVTPGWRESNFQVLREVFTAFRVISDNARISKQLANEMAKSAEKLGDIKLRQACGDFLMNLCEVVGPAFTIKRVWEHNEGHKNPKVIAETMTWIASAIDAFGPVSCAGSAKEFVSIARKGLEMANPQVRSAAGKLLGQIHVFVGPQVRAMCEDMKPSLLSVIDDELKKCPHDPNPPAPARKVRKQKPVKQKAAEGATAAASEDEAIEVNGDEMFPREDISGALSQISSDLSSSAWKVRQAALEAIEKALANANRRVTTDGMADLFQALKGPLADSNKNLIAQACLVVGALATAIGPDVEKVGKGILTNVTKCLADSKKNVREAAIKALEDWASQVPLERMLSVLSAASQPTAKNGSVIPSEGRAAALDIAAKCLSQLTRPPSQDVISVLGATAATSISDKTPEVRAASERLAKTLCESVGDRMRKALDSKSKAALAAVMDKYIAANPSDDGSGQGGALAKEQDARKAKAGSFRSTRTAGLKGIDNDQNDVDQDAPLFATNNAKCERSRKAAKTTKFDETAIHSDRMEEMMSQLKSNSRKDIAVLLMSSDFKHHARAMQTCQENIASQMEGIVSNLDLLCHWMVIRICDNNTTSLLSILAFLDVLVDSLSTRGYQMSDYEANSLLPCLVEKSGHNMDKVRHKYKELLQKFALVYPASKLFLLMADGATKSKNNRTKIECLEGITLLLETVPLEQLSFGKVMPSLGKLLGERDAALRKAALDALVKLYEAQGSNDYIKLIGTLPDAQQELLDEKLKWADRQSQKNARVSKKLDGEAPVPPSPGSMRESATIDNQTPSKLASIQTPASTSVRRSRLSQPEGLVDSALSDALQNSATPSIPGQDGPFSMEDWDAAIKMLQSLDASTNVEGMKILTYYIEQAGRSGNHRHVGAIVERCDELVRYLASAIPRYFAMVQRQPLQPLHGAPGDQLRAALKPTRYLLNTLLNIFNLERVAYGLREATLRDLVEQLLLALLNQALVGVEEGTQVLRALNIVILKILENSDRTTSFTMLLSLLRKVPALPAVSDGSGQTEVHKFGDLVVRCLVKLTKTLAATIAKVDVSRLLLAIHGYFMALNADELRHRTQVDDKPLRMVKTLLYEITKAKGESILSFLNPLIPYETDKPTSAQPLIVQYIMLNLDTLKRHGLLGATQQSVKGEPQVALKTPEKPPPSPVAAIKGELASIFKKIGDKDRTQLGLQELYYFKKAHPEIDIAPHLHKTSEAFRSYIQHGLKKVEEREAAAPTRSPSAIPSPQVSLRASVSDAGTLKAAENSKVDAAENYRKRMQMLRDRVSAPGGHDLDTATLRKRLDTLQSDHAKLGTSISGSAIFQPGQLAGLSAKVPGPKGSSVQVEDLRARMERLRQGTENQN